MWPNERKIDRKEREEILKREPTSKKSYTQKIHLKVKNSLQFTSMNKC